MPRPSVRDSLARTRKATSGRDQPFHAGASRQKKVTILIDEDVWLRLRMESVKHNTTMAEVLRQGAEEWLASHEG